jgi:hypothetical protein
MTRCHPGADGRIQEIYRVIADAHDEIENGKTCQNDDSKQEKIHKISQALLSELLSTTNGTFRPTTEANSEDMPFELAASTMTVSPSDGLLHSIFFDQKGRDYAHFVRYLSGF